jgi:hypothetical protein
LIGYAASEITAILASLAVFDLELQLDFCAAEIGGSRSVTTVRSWSIEIESADKHLAAAEA